MSLLNSSSLNTKALNGASEEVVIVATGVGALVDVEQQVVIIGSGALVDIEQAVILNTIGSGALVSIDQRVTTVGSGALIAIEQRILSTAEKTFFTRNGWDMSVTLGGFTIPRNQIMDAEINRHIGDSAKASVKITPGAGTYDMYDYQGKELTISVRTGSEFKRVFTGTVDIPRADLIKEYITLEATQNRETLIRNNLTPVVPTIGQYSTTLFGAKRSVYQETLARLETTPQDLDFDPYGNYSLNSWEPKASPDYTKSNSDVYYREPNVRIESSRDVINKVEIKLNYAYQRLHQDSISYSWNSSLNVCDFLTLGNTLPTRDMIKNAAQSAGWYVDNLTFTNLWNSGFYTCSGTSIGWVNTRQDVILSSSGATDSSGNNTTNSVITRQSSLNNLLARGADWTARKRYSQNVEEQYTLTVNSPQSQSLYGTRELNLLYNLQADFDPSEWEDESKYGASFSGTRVASSGSTTTYYINRDTNNGELTNAITTALKKAKTDILRSHRDTEINYQEFINPDIDLKHTVSVSTNRVVGKGKVKQIIHRLDAEGEATTDVVLLMFRSTGSQAESTLSAPSRPSNIAPVAISSVALGSRWGQNPSTSQAAKWNGYVGNKWVTVATGGSGFFGVNTDTYFTTYQESFIVDTPSIPASKRADSVRTASQSYNVEIPNDNLSVIFVDS